MPNPRAMRKLRLDILSLMMALLMAFTAVHMGYIRGMSPAVGQMELCTGTGPITVGVDSEGKPASLHYCPDCALTLLAAVAPWQPETFAPSGHQITPFEIDIWRAHGATAPTARARAPPALA
ncbi:hypothetical protein HJ526_12790 [Donghicola sp. C2-DW-16]|uniref:DUF2946 domain-containing protein n=1 Tax=Donghicola mangrovi TaxID=2729614 RepID=A0ABX2PFP2_9RHOB|nr:hypothetical protein [Donghicola mangrovi]NVO28305.1 hypothetical protein [Donghicola mangrovi]